MERAGLPARRERWCGQSGVPRHTHRTAYAAVVLSGGYEECGNRGRFRVRPGDVLLHAAFDAHLDRFGARDTEILNLALRDPTAAKVWGGQVGDADAIVRLAERDPDAASGALIAALLGTPRAERDWPDLLAEDIARDPGLRLESWARRLGLAAETLSRAFKKLYGVTPARFRAETRARRALLHLAGSKGALAGVAARAGFADQPHMTRAVKALTGAPPGAWRATSNRFKTAAPHAD